MKNIIFLKPQHCHLILKEITIGGDSRIFRLLTNGKWRVKGCYEDFLPNIGTIDYIKFLLLQNLKKKII